MAKVVNNYTALLSGSSWGDGRTTHTPVFITYSLETKPYDYLSDFGFSSAYAKSFKPFTANERAIARDALKQWDDASGIVFLQAPSGQGDIRFANYNFDRDPDVADAAAFAYLPATTLGNNDASSLDFGGDISVNTAIMGYGKADMTHVLAHEIGHSIGLKHSFEGNVVLDSAHDNTDYTVMSYTGYGPKLGALDKQAARALYGADAQDGHQVADWSWNAKTGTLTQKGDAGADTIRGVASGDVMFGKGGKDLLFGSGGADRIDGGTGNDTLFGGDGNDTLDGGLGRDRLGGGGGSDRVVFDSKYGSANLDTLTDFTPGKDKLVLDQDVFRALTKTGGLSSTDFRVDTAAQDANDHLIYDRADGALYYDADGVGGAAQVKIALLNPWLSLHASDFLVIA